MNSNDTNNNNNNHVLLRKEEEAVHQPHLKFALLKMHEKNILNK